MTLGRLRGQLTAAFGRALAAVDLEARVREATPRVPARAQAAVVVAIGKAAPAMARGALAAAGERFTRVLVVAPDGVDARFDDREGPVEVLRAPHPDPDRRSVVAARRALEVVSGSDFVLALVSGGASSLVCLPLGVSLRRYVSVTRALLLGGATIQEVNLVRRHLCALKGGGLARAARGRVHTLVASDVIGGAAYDVGSGPTVPDATTRAQARAVVKRFAPRAKLPLHESLKPSAAVVRRLRVRIVARPEDLARAIAHDLRGQVDRVRVLPPSLAPAAALSREYVVRARTLRPGEALVRAAESAVPVDPACRSGRGGRCTHLAALVASELPPDVVFLAGASDGVDGSSGTGGALVDGSLPGLVSPEVLARSIATFDTGPLLASTGMSLPARPSGTNLTDLHVLVRSGA